MEKENRVIFLCLSSVVLIIMAISVSLHTTKNESFEPIIETRDSSTIIELSLPLYDKNGKQTGKLESDVVTVVSDDVLKFYNMNVVNNGKKLSASVSLYNKQTNQLRVLSGLKTNDGKNTLTAISGTVDLNTMEMKNLKGTRLYQHESKKVKVNL